MSNQYLLAIPVYNEEAHVSGVLREARRYSNSILVIDDGSTDSTGQLLEVEKKVSVIRHSENRGYGASLASAFDFARRNSFDWLITMDCDEQHEPSQIPIFMREAEKDDCDVISGSRYLQVDVVDDTPPADRREINRKITNMLNSRLGLSITDAFCGFKAYRVSMLKHFCVTVPGYAMPLQHWVQCWRAGLRIKELPVRLIYNDPTRHFGGMLDDADRRYQHYIEVFEAELAHAVARKCPPSPSGVCCA